MSELTYFCTKSSVNRQELKSFIYSNVTLELQSKIIEELRKWGASYSESFDYKQIAKHMKQSVANFQNSFAIIRNYKEKSSDEELVQILCCVLGFFDSSASILIPISSIIFCQAIKFMGTEKHLQYYDDAFSGKLIGAFCLTEVGHGSNIKLLQTTATYDSNNDEFVVNTPTFEAAKCWSENLGILATHIILYANLITPDGKRHGLHAFIVSIRNTITLLPHPGIMVSSLGEKIGFNGSDHGFMAFNHYRIPRKALLNKFADVTTEGVYIINKDYEHQQLIASFAILTSQRINSALVGNKNTFDASCTTQGDNYVVIQQTANFLLQIWNMILINQEVNFPMNSANFLSHALKILDFKFKPSALADFIKIDNVLEYYKWLTCYLLKQSYDKVQDLKANGLKKFWGINESQIYYCKELAISYIEHFVIQEVNSQILDAPNASIKQILTKILSLYALWNLQKYVPFFYQGRYAYGPEFAKLVEDSILLLSSDLKDDALSLVDVITIPNDLYFSILDQSHEELYKRMETFMQTQDTYSVPKWIHETKMKNNVSSKL
ncbi:hypothetical protein RI129_006489 [Pyrocoelia pectoralis]|uniref:Acyl-coenzyme A oxidase n=1 Tax=Pyrocoelia pectoralis TaxID=417401 RepID=A0AAN7VFE1_9COLE